MARLLVVDRSELLAWRVAKVAPPGVEVERATTFSQAEKMLSENPPDAALFNLEPCHTDWRRLLDECTGNGRLIPYLCLAALDHYEACCCTVPCRAEDLLPMSLPHEDFALKISALIDESREEDPPRFRRLRGNSVQWRKKD